MISVQQYWNLSGKSPFAQWFDELEISAARKVTAALVRMELGNLSNTKSVGSGVLEYKIDYGPGYRIYFGREGNLIVILLGGGTKKKQAQDIENAKIVWKEYKARKSRET